MKRPIKARFGFMQNNPYLMGNNSEHQSPILSKVKRGGKGLESWKRPSLALKVFISIVWFTHFKGHFIQDPNFKKNKILSHVWVGGKAKDCLRMVAKRAGWKK